MFGISFHLQSENIEIDAYSDHKHNYIPTIIIMLSTGLSLLGLILWRFFLIRSNVGLVGGKKLQHLDINYKEELRHRINSMFITQPYRLTSMYSCGHGQSSSVRSLNLIFGFHVESKLNSSCIMINQ